MQFIEEQSEDEAHEDDDTQVDPEVTGHLRDDDLDHLDVDAKLLVNHQVNR